MSAARGFEPGFASDASVLASVAAAGLESVSSATAGVVWSGVGGRTAAGSSSTLHSFGGFMIHDSFIVMISAGAYRVLLKYFRYP